MIKLLHTFAGLLALAPLLVFAVTGISVALHTARMSPAVAASLPFDPTPGATDRQTAERVVALLGLTLATPVQQAAIQHDPSGRIVLDFYHANGRHHVSVLPEDHRLQISIERATLPRYLDILHLTTAAFRTGDWRMHAWSWANEVALWCVFLLMGTGAWMMVAQRNFRVATVRGAHHLTALVLLPVAAIYAVSALQMAHRTWLRAAGVVAWAGRIHRGSTLLAGAIGAGVLAVVTTGVLLWWTAKRYRNFGIVTGAAAALFAAGLIVAMRAM